MAFKDLNENEAPKDIEIFTNKPSTAKKVFRAPGIPPRLVIQAPKVDFVSGGRDSDVSMSFSGLEALEQTLRSMPKFAIDAAGIEMSNIAADVIEMARERVAKKTWALHDSGNFDEYRPGQVYNPSLTEVHMWFGAPPTDRAKEEALQLYIAGDTGELKDTSLYAWEEEHDEHLHHPNGGGPHFLESSFDEVQPNILPRLAKAINEAWGGDSSIQLPVSE